MITQKDIWNHLFEILKVNADDPKEYGDWLLKIHCDVEDRDFGWMNRVIRGRNCHEEKWVESKDAENVGVLYVYGTQDNIFSVIKELTEKTKPRSKSHQ